MNTCKNCKYWEEYIVDASNGDCIKVNFQDAKFIIGNMAGFPCYLQTQSDFGCNQFKEKDNE